MAEAILREQLLKVLITGASGFLGSELIHQAAKAEIQIRAMYRHKAKQPSLGVDNCQADILDPPSLVSAVNGIDAVIHIAGLAHIFNKTNSTDALFKAVNITGTTNIIRAAAQAGVRHFVFVSSVSVYGDTGVKIIDEEAACQPRGPYAESKWQAEQRAIEIAKATGMRLTILRMTTIYGEGDPGNVARLIRTIDKGRFIWVGDGLNHKSLIYIGDAAQSCLMALHSPGTGINIYNISAPPCTMREIVQGLTLALSRDVPCWHVPASLALLSTKIASYLACGRTPLGTLHVTVKKWLAEDIYNTAKAQKAFNFHPRIGLSEGLHREVAWYRNQAG